MDVIFVSDLRIDTTIGIYDWERQIKQTVIIDLEMAADCAKAATTDTVENTLDYKAITKRVVAFVAASEFQLIETLAHRTAEVIRSEFSVSWLRLKLNKRGALRDATDVGVIIERGAR